MAPFFLNLRAQAVADAMEDKAAELRIDVHKSARGRVMDCGIAAEGGLQAGLLLARVCLANLADLTLTAGDVLGTPCPLLQVFTDHPVSACMASQYAGWHVQVGKFFAMGSGPMRAAWGKEKLFDDIPGRETAPVAVGVLESRKMPDEAVFDYIAESTRIAPSEVTLLVAPSQSVAGTVQVVARSLETALHKLHELKFNLNQVVSGYGVAPLPPVAQDEMGSIGRANDAILYGGRVTLWVRAEDGEIADIGPKVPSKASGDHGAPFAEIFERAGRDFYKIDPMLFSPAQVVFHNLKTGKTHCFGQVEPEILRRSFFA